MRFQIRCVGLPSQSASAWLPTPVENPLTVNAGQNKITAMLGNVPVASPRPAAMNDTRYPQLQGSSLAPNYILPVSYVARMNKWLRLNTKAAPHHTIMPVPAVAFNQTTTAQNLKARIGGRTATAAVRPNVSWPTYGNH